MSVLLPAPVHRLSWRRLSWNCWRPRPRTRSCRTECQYPNSSRWGSARRWSRAGTGASGPGSWSTITRWRSIAGKKKNSDWGCIRVCFLCHRMDDGMTTTEGISLSHSLVWTRKHVIRSCLAPHQTHTSEHLPHCHWQRSGHYPPGSSGALQSSTGYFQSCHYCASAKYAQAHTHMRSSYVLCKYNSS